MEKTKIHFKENKVKLKKLLSVALSLVMIAAMSVPAFAAEANDILPQNSSNVEENKPSRNVTYEDYVTVNSSRFLSEVFQFYISKGWSGASSYMILQKETANMTYNGSLTYSFAKAASIKLGLSLSATTTQALYTTIPADPSKDSKLGVKADIKETNVTVERHYPEASYSEYKTGTIKNPIAGAVYFRVIYK